MKKDIPVTYVPQDGVPIPVTYRKGMTQSLRELTVGQSFLIPLADRPEVQTLTSRFKKEGYGEYTTKKVDGEHARVWRIA